MFMVARAIQSSSKRNTTLSTLNNATDLDCNPKSKMITPLIFSFFSGAGFLDLGFEKAGYEIGYVSEIHKPFMDAYKHARREMGISDPIYGFFEGSIEDCLNGQEKEKLSNFIQDAKKSRIVGFIGGPPCPDFSIAGKNRGRDGENGKLSQTYVDLICHQMPDFFLFENVKGLWRTARHREFYEQLKVQLQQAGYECTERLINAIEYGAPQDRERIILFGVNRNGKTARSLIDFDWEHRMKYPKRLAFEYPWPVAEKINKNRSNPKGIPIELTVQHWFEKNRVESHPNSKDQFKPRAGLEKFRTVYEGDDSKKSYKRLHRWRYSPTAAYGNNEVHIHPYLPRRISVSEALAIQSMPADFILPPTMTLSNMFKTIGNGVPFLAAYGIASSILDFFNGEKK